MIGVQMNMVQCYSLDPFELLHHTILDSNKMPSLSGLLLHKRQNMLPSLTILLSHVHSQL